MRTLINHHIKTMSTLLMLAMMIVALVISVSASAAAVPWYHTAITQRYGQNQEHGVDLWTTGRTITALRSGTITFSHEECWNGECVMDITWKLDYPSHAGGSPYMYVQIATSCVHVGQHVADGDALGKSGWFMEIGLTPDKAYGVSGWHWGVNILNVFPYL